MYYEKKTMLWILIKKFQYAIEFINTLLAVIMNRLFPMNNEPSFQITNKKRGLFFDAKNKIWSCCVKFFLLTVILFFPKYDLN